MEAVVKALRASLGKVSVELDEGGLRCTWRDGGAAYVPFEALADATVDTTLFGTTVLVTTMTTGEEVRFKMANGNPFDVLGAIVARIAERSRPDAEVRAGHHAFDRGELSLGAWLDSVRRHACGAEAYRDAAPDRAAFAALLDDDRTAAPLRAAAAHALLTMGTDDDLALVAQALVHRALPPLVLVAAGLAPGGCALVDDELLAEMKALLPSRDRDEITVGAVERADPAQSKRVAAALTMAKEQASDDARQAAVAHARAHAGDGARRPLHPVSAAAGNAGRWVGRSWGL